MNNQLKELYDQVAGNDKLGFDSYLAEKFAELIIRECADLAREWEDDYVVEDTAPFHSDVKIKQHFGVEE